MRKGNDTLQLLTIFKLALIINNCHIKDGI
jgi:hypothetical protein